MEWVINMKKVRVCSFCSNMRINGIAILEQWMCNECEEKLLNTNIEDPIYDQNKEQIKNIWKGHYILSKQYEMLKDN